MLANLQFQSLDVAAGVRLVISMDAWHRITRWWQRAVATAVGRAHQGAEKGGIHPVAVGEVVVRHQSMQQVITAAGCNQQAATEQGHQRMGLLLKALRQGDPSDFQVIGAAGQGCLDPWIDMLQVRAAAAGQVARSGGNELQPGGAGEIATAAFHQQQMVVVGVATIQIPFLSGTGELLSIGGLPQLSDRIGNLGKGAA